MTMISLRMKIRNPETAGNPDTENAYQIAVRFFYVQEITVQK